MTYTREAERLPIDEMQAIGIIQEAVALYSEHPQEDGARPYWIYASYLRPLSHTWAPISNSWFVKAEVKVNGVFVHTWTVSEKELPEPILYSYDLAISYEPKRKKTLQETLAEVDAEGLSDEELEDAAAFFDQLLESRERNQ